MLDREDNYLVRGSFGDKRLIKGASDAPDPSEVLARYAPPHSIEAEQSVLGALLIDQNAVERVQEMLSAEDFYRDDHSLLFETILALSARSEPIDTITVQEELKKRGRMDAIGGQAYLMALLDAVPTAANVEFYAKIVQDKAVLRRLIEASLEVVGMARGTEVEDVSELVDTAERLIFGVAQRRTNQFFSPLPPLLLSVYERAEVLNELKERISGLPTGIGDFDMMTAGLQNSDMVIVAARPSMGKCLAANTEIVLKDGSISTIEEIYRRGQADLLTLGPDHRFAWTQPSAFVDDGIKPVYEVITRLGRKVRTTLSHPFLTIGGWRPLHEITAGTKIAVPRRVAVFGSQPMRDCEVKLMAYLIGDGGLTGKMPHFTNVNPRIQEDFSCCVREFGGVVAHRVHAETRAASFRVVGDPEFIRNGRLHFASGLKRHMGLYPGSKKTLAAPAGVHPAAFKFWLRGECAPKPETYSALCNALTIQESELAPLGIGSIRRSSINPLTAWLTQHGLFGKGAHDKSVPDCIFTLPQQQLALFLNRLFATDGWISVYRSGQTQIGYSSVDETLIRQVQHLLLRFGIVSAVRSRSVKDKEMRRTAWQLEVHDALSLKTFIDEIGVYGKETSLYAAQEAVAAKRYQTDIDLIPREIWDVIAKAKGDESWSSLAKRAKITGHTNIHVGRRSLSRARLAQLAKALQDKELTNLADSEIYWDEIVSIDCVGDQQVYDLTIPETHNFVANDICVHNTSLCLSIAQHVALREGKTCAIFSLEMSKEQLAMRMLCSEAQVSSHRVRTGHLNEDEWDSLARVVQGMYEAPIYIDDNTEASVLTMRAKCRRLQAEQGLGLIIVDYLQLMRSHRKIENRVQEIGDIARGLKSLARELNVPVIALSQLSRAVEHRENKRPMLSDLRECVAGDTRLTNAETGDQIPIRDLQPGTWVLGLDAQQKIREFEVEDVWSTGVKPTWKLTTQTGRSVVATANHPYLTATGWKRLHDLVPGEIIAGALRLPDHGEERPERSELCRLLGYLTGDGTYQKHRAVGFCGSDPSVVSDAIRIVTDCFPGVTWREKKAYGSYQEGHFSRVYENGHGHPFGNPLREWLREIGVEGTRDNTKQVPSWVFEAGKTGAQAFLAGYLSTDGCVKRDRQSRWTVHFDTVSHRLAEDVQCLLLRLGIIATISGGYKSKKATQPIYRIQVLSIAENLRRFIEQVVPVGRKGELLAEASRALPEGLTNGSLLGLPPEISDLLYQKTLHLRQQGRKLTTGKRLYWKPQGKRPRRDTCALFAELLKDETLSVWVHSDLLWEEIKSIEPAGDQEVYDLKIPGCGNFLADGIIAHNSGSIEAEADLVCFLYRESYYKMKEAIASGEKFERPDTELIEETEIIIGKHRNGPTGMVKIGFMPDYAKFVNLERNLDDGSTGF